MPLIDYWCNPFTPEQRRKGFFGDPEMLHLTKWWHMEERVEGMEPGDFVKMMDEQGVDIVMTMSFKMYSFRRKTLMWDITDEEIHEAVKGHPDRLKGACGINPFERMEGVRRLERAVKELGFVAAHLHAYGFGLDLNHRDYFPFYAKCAELGVPIIMQVGHSAEFLPSSVARPIFVDDIAIYFPDLKIFMSHTGWPWTEEAIAVCWKHPNVYLGTAGHNPKYLDKSFVRFVNARGRGKVLFGSTHPVVLYDDGIKNIEALGLKEKAKEEYMHLAARRVFGFGGE